MSDLFLRIRLQALERSLLRVSNLRKAVKDSNEDLQALHQAMVLTFWRINSITSFVKDLNSLNTAYDLPDAYKLTELLRKLRMEERLRAANDETLGVTQQLEQLISRTERLKDQIDEIENVLKSKTADIFDISDIFPEVDNLLPDVWELKRKLEGGDPVDAEIWERLDEIFRRARRDIFMNYVDVAGGLSIRRAGLDGRVCIIADRLCNYWSIRVGDRYVTPVFSLPGREELRASSTVVNLAFPEWTIWGLPLLAHDVCSLALAHGSYTRNPAMVTLVADAFATLVMGPAYACAALLLRLDPAEKIDRDRASVILETLTQVNYEFQGAMESEVSLLRDAWATALAPPTAASAACDGYETEQATAAQNRSEVVETAAIIDRAKDLVRSSSRAQAEYPMKFNQSDLRIATKVRDGLLKDEVEIPFNEGEVTERQALNGAWLARLENQDAQHIEAIMDKVKSYLAPSAQELRQQARASGALNRPAIPTGINQPY